MAKGDPGPRVLEEGDIAFLYRPKVGHPRARGPEDVQRLFVLLTPHRRRRHRLLVVGRKRLPDPTEHGHERFWGYVAMVEDDVVGIRAELEPRGYPTRTRGWREQPGARTAGEGTYRILRHGSHTHLTYALRAPVSLGEVQEDLRIQPQASHILTIKNPAHSTAPEAREDDAGAWEAAHHQPDVSLPPPLMARFRGRRYAEADPPSFLDHEGVEFILIAASDDVEAELGTQAAAEDAVTPRDVADELGLETVRSGPTSDGDWE